jgi:NAD+ synthetase
VRARGATRQDEATSRGRLVAEAVGAEIWEAPLAGAHAAVIASLTAASGLAFDAWSEGQTLSVVRTPALYGAAALLQAHAHRSIVVGTTNRDEGSYLGFFGKASDGMVDLQPIADLHKSEVRALARHFGVPEAAIAAVPSGDVHDGRSDEDMIGASYDEVELFLRLQELSLAPALAGLRPAAVAAIEQLHDLNRHKYVVGCSSAFVDVMPRGVPGGWPDEVVSGRSEKRPAKGALPGEWEPPPIALDPVAALPPEPERLRLPGIALRARCVLTAGDCERLREAMATSGQAVPVGVTGIADGYGIGSVRATAWSPELAQALWRRLAPTLPSVRFLDALTPTDGFATATRAGHRTWRVVGLSPVLRFMRYDTGGRHLAHYDAGFDYGDGRRTLLSAVFYLTDAWTSGATRFVRDGQESQPARERDFSDWSRDTRADEVLVTVHPRIGDALVFDHRLGHDVQRWDGPGPRVIVRGDVVYEAVPDGRAT